MYIFLIFFNCNTFTVINEGTTLIDELFEEYSTSRNENDRNFKGETSKPDLPVLYLRIPLNCLIGQRIYKFCLECLC